MTDDKQAKFSGPDNLKNHSPDMRLGYCIEHSGHFVVKALANFKQTINPVQVFIDECCEKNLETLLKRRYSGMH